MGTGGKLILGPVQSDKETNGRFGENFDVFWTSPERTPDATVASTRPRAFQSERQLWLVLEIKLPELTHPCMDRVWTTFPQKSEANPANLARV